MKPSARRMQDIALTLLQVRGTTGLTSDELEGLTGWRHQTASARLRELVLAGLAKDTDRRRLTSSGRTAVVRVAT